jgi:hypothetical protein
MQYLLGLIGEEPNFEEISPDEMQATIDLMDRYNQELRDAGAMIYGAGLRERATATVVGFPLEEGGGQPTVTDGPFAETKEQLMGFWIIEAANLDEALAWTKKAPLQGVQVEVRPLVEEAGENDISGAELLERVTEKH